ncbi:hypothetical protein QYM36_004032 [Artemia franciscana]|uniref:RBR-type E3 ubiquitin transferase n=1 Tax=Artemia franciscana TaxID=6661 RepID=A0AA88LFS8_ARTSF|nr:hypothetical protein QYM36_004032 [Artemia franciscana]
MNGLLIIVNKLSRKLLGTTSNKLPSVYCLEGSKTTSLEECALCLDEYPSDQMTSLSSCEHRPCQSCFTQYLKIEISESRVIIACPECEKLVHPNDIYAALQDKIMIGKYEDFMVRRVLLSDPDARWCPAPDCGFAVIASGCAGCPNLKCERPGCDTEFCYHCKAVWHPDKTCDAARTGRKSRRSNSSFDNPIFDKDKLRKCPRCQIIIMKVDDGSCNHMTCACCGSQFCWLCMKEITDLHYLSPSGCTFWGKKPWSKKKKILWQVGILIGAPVGIALLAGIAVPAIIIGLPVWVARKLSAKSKKKKKMGKVVVGSAVIATVLVSPFVAVFTVALGVPICLAYVYGVVPISLMRSGGCGVTNEKEEEFDLENDPDILEFGNENRLESFNDRKVTVSGCGATYNAKKGDELPIDYQNRSVIPHDASGYCLKYEGPSETTVKRYSLTSETVSLSERSVTLSCTDDCSSSTRGFAGSVLNYKFTNARGLPSSSFTPAEVYIDGRSQSEGESSSKCGENLIGDGSKRRTGVTSEKQVTIAEASPDYVDDVDVEMSYITPPEGEPSDLIKKEDLKSLATTIASRLSQEVTKMTSADDDCGHHAASCSDASNVG